jgi:hypothetical protein
VIRVLACRAVIAMVIALLIGPKFIEFLRRTSSAAHPGGGPEGHRVKQGTRRWAGS